jgi:hypothetical protein
MQGRILLSPTVSGCYINLRRAVLESKGVRLFDGVTSSYSPRVHKKKELPQFLKHPSSRIYLKQYLRYTNQRNYHDKHRKLKPGDLY